MKMGPDTPKGCLFRSPAPCGKGVPKPGGRSGSKPTLSPSSLPSSAGSLLPVCASQKFTGNVGMKKSPGHVTLALLNPFKFPKDSSSHLCSLGRFVSPGDVGPRLMVVPQAQKGWIQGPNCFEVGPISRKQIKRPTSFSGTSPPHPQPTLGFTLTLHNSRIYWDSRRVIQVFFH